MQPSARVKLCVGSALFATAIVGVVQAVPARAAADHLVINEVYARGGSANQPYKDKFVEILNPTGAAISLSGLSLQYRSATGTGNANSTVALSGSLAAGDVFVLQGGSNGTTGAALPAGTVDQTATGFNPSGTTGTVYLVSGATATTPDASSVIDKVGFGGSNSPEGTAVVYTGANGDPGSIGRTTTNDTNNNSADFAFSATVTPGALNPGQTGGDPTDPPTDPTDPPADAVSIAQIQGNGAASPLVGTKVTTRGVVTANYPTGGFNGFYLQTPGSGGAPKSAQDSSDGVFVYGTTTVTVGDCYDVTGTVKEFNGLTELDQVTLTPAAGCDPVTATPLATLPVTDADKEAYEGMLVAPQGTYTITNNYDLNTFGQLGLAVGDKPLYTPTDKVPYTEAAAYEAEQVKKLITLDDGSSWNYMTNATAKNSPLPYLSAQTPVRTNSQVSFTKPVILDYRFQWNYQPTSQVVGANAPFLASENDRPATVPNVGGDVQLATFNVLNYFTDLGKDEAGCASYKDRLGNPVAANNCAVRGAWSQAAFDDQQAKIVKAINGLDAEVVALMEIENSANFGHDRDATLSHLVDVLNQDDPAKAWKYVPTNAGQVPPNEDNIRLAFIYRSSAVAPVGGSQILSDPAFANARQPLAQQFTVTGSRTSFVAVANHFKSKGSGEDDGTGQGLSNPSRKAQASALTSWVNAQFADQPVFLLGDFNAYSAEEPVQIIEGAGFANVVTSDDTTYQFGGRLGSLDHVFGNAAAKALVSAGAVWNINGDESIAFQYSRRNYNVTDFYAADPYASSDHDPAVVGIKAAALVPPSLGFFDGDCNSFGFTVSGDVPEGAKLKVTWTRDGQGQVTTVAPQTWWSGNGQLGWAKAQATLLAADGSVIVASEVQNPTCVTPAVTVKGNQVTVQTAGLPADALVTVKARLDNGTVTTFTTAVTGKAVSFKAPSVKSAVVEVTSGDDLIGYASAMK
ncbi:ExeM/NucH family extracellular endonuclease [Aestuariimicrobium soli]|uniref:ExeM/NucH family extracellular endonuclease n=1 Tax=Aestuariimicrobium soli TaxID=2035834 RepID=UPI003EBDB67C